MRWWFQSCWTVDQADLVQLDPRPQKRKDSQMRNIPMICVAADIFHRLAKNISLEFAKNDLLELTKYFSKSVSDTWPRTLWRIWVQGFKSATTNWKNIFMSGNIFRSCLITTVSDNHIFGSWLVTSPPVRHVRQFTIDLGSRFQKRNKYDLLDKRYKCLKMLCHIMLCCSKPGHICFGLFSKN